ncbi:MAG: 50S ribosomal protein L24 [Pseudomonadota bacterium]
MAVKLKMKKGDRVVVTTGKDKGKRGDVEKVIRGEKPGDHRVVVSGVNIVKRHTRPTQTNPGGIIEREAPIHISNVAIVDPKDDAPSRIGYSFLDDGSKVRFARRSGEIIDR